MATQTARAGAPKGELRLDLQGVRGLGVSLVVIGHLFLWPAGVFAALDMFFTLSGFLITAILVPSIQKHGFGFFAPFYLSRARRLVPMATLVLVFTVVAVYVTYSEARAVLVGEDALWAFVFAVNWHFIAQGNDYFALHTASPLQHYWSLSVEEQFYLVWPLLVLIAVTVAARVGRVHTRTVVGWVLGTATAATFVYSLWHSATHPEAAYFSTFDRAWEFGAGGLLALWAHKLTDIPRWLKIGLSWLGVIGILVTIFFLDTGLPFPAPFGLLPVGMTLALIVSGLDGESTRQQFVLHNPVMIYLGTISYSIYLWHMPIQVVLAPLLGLDTLPYYVTSLVVTLLASVLSYHLVERPLRQSRLLMLPSERRRRPPAPALEPWVGAAVRRWGGVAALAGVMASLYVGVVVVRERAVAPVPLALGAAAQRDQLATALDATEFPRFVPSLDELGAQTWEQEHAKTACVDDTLPVFADCVFGDTPDGPTVAVVGDSFAIAWMPTIQAAFEARGWQVQQLTMTQCTSWTLPSYVQRTSVDYPECGVLHDQVADWVQTQEPDLVILASSFDQVLNATRPGMPSDDPTELAEIGLGATLARLDNGVTKFAVLQPPPPHRSLVDCVSRFGRPTACNSSPSEFWYDHVEGEQAAAEAAGAQYVETVDWFCIDYRCPAWAGSTPVTWDGAHLTVEYARSLGPALAAALFPGDADAPEVTEASG